MTGALTEARARKVDEIVDHIAELTEHCDDVVIGAALSEVVAGFIAAHPADERENILNLVISTVRTAWPAIAGELGELGDKQ